MVVFSLNSPLKSVTAPNLESTILTDAPMSSSPVSSSIIFPEILVCDRLKLRKQKKDNSKNKSL